MRCSICGNEYFGYHCQACATLKTIEREAERNRDHQNELAEEASYRRQEEFDRQARMTAAIAIDKAEAYRERTEILGREAARQSKEAALQTKILLEQSITTDEAYSQGYALIEQIFEDEFSITSKCLHQHQIDFRITEEANVVIASITPDFVTPKLIAAYRSGVTQRFTDGVFYELNKAALLEQATRHGFDFDLKFELTTVVYPTNPANSETAFPECVTAKTEPFEFQLDLQITTSTGQMKNVNRITSLFTDQENNFYHQVQASYAQGLKERLAFENESSKCQERLDQFQLKHDQQLAAAAEVELARKTHKKSANLFKVIRFFFVATLIGYGYALFNTGHWFLSIVSLITGLIFGTFGVLGSQEITTNKHTLLTVFVIDFYLLALYMINERYDWLETLFYGFVVCAITGFSAGKIESAATNKRDIERRKSLYL